MIKKFKKLIGNKKQSDKDETKQDEPKNIHPTGKGNYNKVKYSKSNDEERYLSIKVKPYLEEKGYYGYIGKVSNLLSLGTEAIPEFIGAELISFLSICIGRGNIYKPFGTGQTIPRCNALLVGKTGIGKGLSSQQLSCIKEKVKPKDLLAPVHSGGLSTTEGLIYAIRDDSEDENGNVIEGVKDKRLFIIEEEFSNVIQQTKKGGSSTLSSTIRCLYDGKPLEPLTKFNRIGCAEPHVGIYAHITPNELLTKLDSNELSNGFLNRFAIYYGSMRPDVPFSKPVCEKEIENLSSCLSDIVSWSNRDVKEFTFSEGYENLWNEKYNRLRNLGSEDSLEKDLLTRARHYAAMYAMIFAATDKTSVINEMHLEAALAWVDYWHQSVKYIYNTEFEEVKAENRKRLARDVFKGIRVLIERNDGKPIGKTPITKHFSGRFTAEEIAGALEYMQELPEPPIKVTLLPRNKHEIQLT